MIEDSKEKNWDPGVKKFFVRIVNSIAITLAWIMACAIAGIYFGLGNPKTKPVVYTVIFYVAMLVTLLLLIRYLHRIWKFQSKENSKFQD